MSGLLVKSTVVMKENLQEMNTRGVAEKFPVLLGGAALTRGYVENDLAEVYEGEVHYARDAFEGLKLMDVKMSAKRGEAPDVDSPEAVAAREKEAERKARHERSKRIAAERKAKETPVEIPERSVEEYFKLGYRGAGFSFGYGACPNLDDRAKMMELLEPGRIGVELSEELQLHPSSPPTRSCCTTPRPSTSTSKASAEQFGVSRRPTERPIRPGFL